jgi:hypothetical protein
MSGEDEVGVVTGEPAVEELASRLVITVLEMGVCKDMGGTCVLRIALE